MCFRKLRPVVQAGQQIRPRFRLELARDEQPLCLERIEHAKMSSTDSNSVETSLTASRNETV